MNLRRRLVALLVLLARTGCTRLATGPGQPPHAPYSQDDERINRPDMM
jgi:hypothetical protein